ncbi:MAG: rod shape-determining protein [Pseudomonadota bacterium]|nr:rod shape-determining protein [Pseudomonadota bacterium]
MLGSLFKRGSTDLAIDLGTANTVVYRRGSGIVINEPSVVAIETINGVQRVRAVGADAKLMMGKTPANLKTIRPLRSGVIADIDVAEKMIKHFIHKANGGRSRFRHGPEIVMCIPSGSTMVERRAIRDAARTAGASRVWLLSEPMAAAIGAGLEVMKPRGSLVVDIGGGTTEVGVISLHGLTYSSSVRVGGDRMDDAITQSVRRNHNLLIGEATAEKLKTQLGIACLGGSGPGKVAVVRGRDVAVGMPREVEITQRELVDALKEPLGQVIQAVRQALENTPPEIAADIMDDGITMTGGGSLLPEIDRVLADETGLSVKVADAPLICVAMGAGRTLEDPHYRGALYGA